MAVTWVMYSPDFAQWKCARIAGQNDHGTGWIGLQLAQLELIPSPM